MRSQSLKSKLWISLGVHILAGANAGVLFTQLDSKILAGFLASSGFLAMACTHYFLYIQEVKRPFVFWANLGFLFTAAGPLAYERFSDWSSPKLASILGFDPDGFHKFSEGFFLVVLVVLIFDLFLQFMSKKERV